MITIAERVQWPRVAFGDRSDAGRALADVLVSEPDPSAVVMALPRGGLPVAAYVARALRCELHLLGVRKLPLPDSPEMGFGAVTLDGTVTLNHALMREHGVSLGQAALIIDRVREEVARRISEYQGSISPLEFTGRRVYLIDDGLATGYTMIAACGMVRHGEPSEVVVGVPVAPIASVEALAPHCDRIVCLIAQEGQGFAVASYYRHFPDLTDAEVQAQLAQAATR